MKLMQKARIGIIKLLMPPNSGRWLNVLDHYPGAFQQDQTLELDSVLTFSSVFRCVHLISTDIGKLGLRLVRLNNGIWEEFTSSAFSPVLRKPNPYQTRIKFYVQWVISKLLHGNTYVLKVRDNRGLVTSMRVLDPMRVQTLVSDSGEVFYRLRMDHLMTLHETEIIVPSTEIIHDVYMTPEHPLIGVSAIGACGRSAMQGIKIQANSQKFFENMSRPSGMLSAPGHIADDTATRLKTTFETNFGGDNIGKMAVAGDGLKFETFAMNATDSQLVEQLKLTAEDVCRAFGVPPYKVGIGPMPAYNNIEALQQAYYSETLQELIESIELLLDEGLELPNGYGTEFDLSDLLRMDTKTQSEIMEIQSRAGLLAPDEGRRIFGRRPVPGGKYPYMQQQNYSLEALAKRDTQEDPFASNAPAPAEPEDEEEETEEPTEEESEDQARTFQALFQKAASC